MQLLRVEEEEIWLETKPAVCSQSVQVEAPGLEYVPMGQVRQPVRASSP